MCGSCECGGIDATFFPWEAPAAITLERKTQLRVAGAVTWKERNDAASAGEATAGWAAVCAAEGAGAGALLGLCAMIVRASSSSRLRQKEEGDHRAWSWVPGFAAAVHLLRLRTQKNAKD